MKNEKSNHDSEEVLSDQYFLIKEKIIQLRANYTNLRIDDFYRQVNRLERMFIEIDHEPKAAQLKQNLREIRDNYESMRHLMNNQSAQRRDVVKILVALFIGFLTVFAILYVGMKQVHMMERNIILSSEIPRETRIFMRELEIGTNIAHWDDCVDATLYIKNQGVEDVYITNIELSFPYMGGSFELDLSSHDEKLRNIKIKGLTEQGIRIQINPFFYENAKDLRLNEFLDKELEVTIRVYMNKKNALNTSIIDNNPGYKYKLKITAFIEFKEKEENEASNKAELSHIIS